MSELNYGKNVEWFLRELSAHEAGDIESAEIEVIGENDQGAEGFTTIDITLLAADAVSVISAMQQKLDAVLAENVALKGFFETGINASFEGCDFFGDHIQSRALELGLIRDAVYCKDLHENLVVDPGNFEDGDTVFFINETPSTDAILNEVRAEGVEMYAQSLRRKQEDAFTESEYRHTKLGRAAVSAEKFAAQLRAGSTEGSIHD